MWRVRFRSRSRRHADALIVDPAATAAQAVSIACDHAVESQTGARVDVHAETLCVHGDTPDALGIARAVRTALEARGVRIAPVGSHES